MLGAIDWKSLIWKIGYPRLNDLANQRFGKGGLAEEAVTYVLEKIPLDKNSKLNGYEGKSKPETYLYTILKNYLEEFSRKRFGRPRPPSWLKTHGQLWIDIWQLICLDRQHTEIVIDRFVNYGIHEHNFINTVIRTIKARIPSCGIVNREIAENSKVDDDGHQLSSTDAIPDTHTPEKVLEVANYKELIVMIAYLLNGDVLPKQLNIDKLTKLLGNQLTKKLQLLKEEFIFGSQELIILKMVYQDGFKISVVARSLGIADHMARRTLQNTLNNIRNALKTVGLPFDEIRELLYDNE